MTPIADSIKQFAQALLDAGIPALISYREAGEWHLAAPGYDWAAIAGGLRDLADECDRQAEARRTLN